MKPTPNEMCKLQCGRLGTTQSVAGFWFCPGCLETWQAMVKAERRAPVKQTTIHHDPFQCIEEIGEQTKERAIRRRGFEPAPIDFWKADRDSGFDRRWDNMPYPDPSRTRR